MGEGLRGLGASSGAGTGTGTAMLGDSCQDAQDAHKGTGIRVSAGMQHPAKTGGKKWGQTFLNTNCLHTAGIQTLCSSNLAVCI